VPPDVSAQHADAVDQAVADLKYGSININVVTMLGFCVPKLTWGAYPGKTPQVEMTLIIAPVSKATCSCTSTCGIPGYMELGGFGTAATGERS
jgi:hypothetical protein